jgi:hypothetical protein
MPVAVPPAQTTVHGKGGAAIHVSVRLPPGYRIVLQDRARLHAAAPQFEIVRGKAQYGVLMLVPVSPAPDLTRIDPAMPARGQSVQAAATFWAKARGDRVQRVTRDGFLVLHDGRPVQVFVRLHGVLPAIVVGFGSGRALLLAVARTMVARWIAPVPLGGASDAAALELRDRANAAIEGQDAFSSTFSSGTPLSVGYTVDTSRSARYQAIFAGATRTSLIGFVSGSTAYAPGSCWKPTPALDTGRFLAPRLPLSAPGLTYEPVEQAGALLRLRYRYWTLDATPRTVQVELDPATLLPVRSETSDVLGKGSNGVAVTQTSWTWGSVTRAPLPRRC